jgi:hypothetical protein
MMTRHAQRKESSHLNATEKMRWMMLSIARLRVNLVRLDFSTRNSTPSLRQKGMARNDDDWIQAKGFH